VFAKTWTVLISSHYVELPLDPVRTGYLSECDCEIYALNNKRCMVAHDHIFLFHILFEVWMPTAKPFFFYLTICHLYVIIFKFHVMFIQGNMCQFFFLRVPLSK